MEREGGFIVIHRRIESWPLYAHLRADQRHVVTTLLLMANWKDSELWTLRGPVSVKRGQLVASEYAIAERAGCGRQVVRTVIALLEREGFLARVPAFSNPTANPANARTPHLITITNYGRFQSVKDDGGNWANPAANQKPTQSQPRANLEPTPSEPEEPYEPEEPTGRGAAAAPADAAPEHAGTTPLLFASEPSRPRARKRASSNADPRHAPFMAMFFRVFQEVRGQGYVISRADGPQLSLWLKGAPADVTAAEAEVRWRRALTLGSKWPGCSSISHFVGRWNDLAATPALTGRSMSAPTPADDFDRQGPF